MSENPNLKCRYCGIEKNHVDMKEFSHSIMVCADCLHKARPLQKDYKFKLKTRLINYIKRLQLNHA